MADKIVGDEQCGGGADRKPKEIYDVPKTAFVANFIGTMNLYRRIRKYTESGLRLSRLPKPERCGKWKAGKASLKKWSFAER